jgi:Fe-S cluster biogenesis protein NfuA
MATQTPPGEAPSGPERHLTRVQELTDAIEALPAGREKELAEELVGAVIELYGEGLARIVDALAEAGAAGQEIHERLVGDGVVASLLLIHDLYPVDLETRVHEALASVRPYMESHGGDVELLALEDGVARLRLVGHCEGCPASAATLELAIKEALDEAAPDLAGLEVEGVAAPKSRLAPSPGLIQLTMADGAPAAAPTPTWMSVDGVADVAPGELRTVTVHGAELVVANVGGTLLAYRSACAGCGAALGDASLRGEILTCARCGRGFDLPRAGRALGSDDTQLEPVPLLRPAGAGVKVALARPPSALVPGAKPPGGATPWA